MTKLSTETLVAFLDAMYEFGSLTNAARVIGVGRQTAHKWIQQSRLAEKNGEAEGSSYWLNYAGHENFLHAHVKNQTKAMVDSILENALLRARDGTTKQTYFQGRRVPSYDYELAEMLDLPPEQCLLRDQNGRIVFETETVAPSNELVLAMLAAHNKRFAKRLSVDHNHAISGGVMIAHNVGSAPLKELQEQRSLPAVQILDAEIVAEIVADEAIEPSSEPDEAEAEQAEAEAVESATPSAMMTDLRRDLLERAAAKGLIS